MMVGWMVGWLVGWFGLVAGLFFFFGGDFFKGSPSSSKVTIKSGKKKTKEAPRDWEL